MKQTQRDGRNNKYVLIPEVKILGRKNTKQTQRRGTNIRHGRTQHVCTYIHIYIYIYMYIYV